MLALKEVLVLKKVEVIVAKEGCFTLKWKLRVQVSIFNNIRNSFNIFILDRAHQLTAQPHGVHWACKQ
jgi:hypothetical protein